MLKVQLAVMYTIEALKHTVLHGYVDFVSDYAYILQDARSEGASCFVVLTTVVPCLIPTFYSPNTQWLDDRFALTGNGATHF